MRIPSWVRRSVRLTVLLTALLAAIGPSAADAFTLVGTQLFVNPKAGYTTSLVQVRATQKASGCPGTTFKFQFYFDSKPLWAKSVSACNTSTFTWDTGLSPYIKPPVSPTVGAHVVSVQVCCAATGGLIGSANYTYRIYPAPTTPQAAASPTQAAVTPSQTVASPSSSSCPVAALPAAGTGSFGDTLIAGLVMFSVIPIVGLALIGPAPLLAAARRRRKLLMLLGLSALAALTLSCASSVSEQPTPAALVSPASSPSCSA